MPPRPSASSNWSAPSPSFARGSESWSPPSSRGLAPATATSESAAFIGNHSHFASLLFPIGRARQFGAVQSIRYPMPLAAGTRLGPYEIVEPIGAGGMGEVYRARDTKLKRDVAIKVLPDAFARDPERMARFQREAELLASLNHPNIAAIYGVEDRALVMELVEGESPKGPLPFDDAWKIASQIVTALEYAHDKGIVHRDLKPANIKITPEGVVKLLDFGLAKAFTNRGEARTSADPENSPTLTMGATEVGMILGTAAYMPPEQAKGKQVDKRADIWSFGVVLYELLTGERLFKGDDATDTLAQVLTKEPDLGKVPRQARRLIEECLQKDPKRRLRDMGDAPRLVESGAGSQPAAASQAASRRPVVWVTAAALLGAGFAVAGVGWWRASHPGELPLKPLVRLDVDLGPDVALGSALGADVILSPDGTRLVYVSQGKLFTRRMDQLKATELAGTEGANSPFFSPDGQWVGFDAGRELKKVSVEGGSAIALCGAQLLAGASWGDDGDIIAALALAGGLSRIPSAGGAPVPVTEMAQGEVSHRWPQILPGGKAVLFTTNNSTGGWDGGNIEVMTFVDRRRKTLQRGGTYGRYIPISRGAGYLSYVNGGTLFAVPFDLDTLTVRGTPSPVLQEVAYSPGNGFAQLDFSRGGTLVYRSGEAGGGKLLTVQWLDSSGKTQPLLAKPDRYTLPRLSPDGQRLALTINSDIWIYEWQRDTMTRLTFSGGSGVRWSPDGRYIVYEGPGGMFWNRSDGAGQPQRLTQSKDRQVPQSFAPDGKRLAFFQFVPGGTQIRTIPLENDGSGLRAGQPELFLQTPSQTASVDRHPAFSPDGRWLAFSSNESGRDQVYVRAFPDKGGKWQISNDGGLYPEWLPNRRELFFRANDNRIMIVTYTVKGDSFVADKPRLWSQKQLADPGVPGETFAPAPGGKRVAALMTAEGPGQPQAQNHVIFLENFFDELRRRVPLGAH
ncbi:MAG TPA: protein kinase [Bryobacteraceae bacterium]|nr:protein kinase [Bryobacteraceae bacterium]